MISSKGIKVGKTISKTLTPGVRKCKINSVVLEEDKYRPGSDYVILNLEGEELKDFEGFWRVAGDHSKGQYKGQTGRVKNSKFSIKEATVNGEVLSKDKQVITFLTKLATELGLRDKLDAIEAETITDWVSKVSTLVSNGTYLNFSIGGREYENSQGFTNYDLNLVKPDKGKVAFEALTVAESDSQLTIYDPAKHLQLKKAPKPVTTQEFDDGISLTDDLALTEIV